MGDYERVMRKYFNAARAMDHTLQPQRQTDHNRLRNIVGIKQFCHPCHKPRSNCSPPRSVDSNNDF